MYTWCCTMNKLCLWINYVWSIACVSKLKSRHRIWRHHMACTSAQQKVRERESIIVTSFSCLELVMLNYPNFDPFPHPLKEWDFSFARSTEIFEAFTISCGGTASNTLHARSRLAFREELAVLFLVEEQRPTHSVPKVGWRAERSWIYYACRRAVKIF